MNNFKKTSLLALLSTICFTIINIFITTNVSAEAINVSAPDTWKERAAITGLYECYDSVYMRGQIEEIGSFNSFGQAFYDSTNLEPSQTSSILNIGMYNWEGKEAYNCKQFFMGGDAEDGNSDFKGVFNIFGKSGTASTWQEKTNLVKNMGYTEAQASEQSSRECTYYVFAFSNEALGIRRFYLTQNVCLTNDNQITVKSAVSGCTEELSPAPESGCSDDDEDSSGDFIRFLANSDGKTLSVKTKTGVYKDFVYNGNWDEFKGNIDQFFLGDLCTERTPDNRCVVRYERVSLGGQASPPDVNVFVYNRNISNSASVQDTNSYEITDYTSAADKATNFLSNGQYNGKNDKIKITKPEKYAYYLKALKEVLEKGGGQYYSCYTIGSDLATNVGIDNEQDYINKYSSLGIPINVDFSGKTNPKTTAKVDGQQISYCVILKSAVETHSEDTVPNWVNDDGFFNLTGSPRLDIAALIEEINNLSNEVSESDLMATIDSDSSYTRSTPESTNTQTEATCQNSGGAGSLGWIVCSILDWMANATEFMYDNIVEPALRIEPELFTTTGGQGQNAEAAWRIFRDFANIIFIILLLIVIFSQLTGYGIDNYGIKKILPKLIVVAVLVNLSYLICLICVDLSNIVGNGIQDVFNGMTGQISANITIDPLNGALPAGATSNVAVDVDARAGIAAVTIAGLAVGAYALYSNPALLLTLFISVLGVLISVLFVFILLAGRKAAIVLLTVVSPIAFILYMLPNTKKIYDKWFNLWKAMLLVYPICGLLIGGGNFASQLMLGIGQNTSTPAASVFTAMIVGIVPIFFIPTVIKSAYAALGSIGGTLAGFGGRLRGGFTRGARNSNLVRDTQKRSQDRSQRINAMRRAGVRLDKDGKIVESGRPTAALRRRIAESDSGFLGWVNRRTGLQASMGQGAAEFAKMESARRGNLDNANLDMINTQFAKDENARMMQRAEAEVGVAKIDDNIAKQRAVAARNAQAYKAFQDQYANYSVKQLKDEAKNAASLRTGADGSQRVSALINAMESRGMENDITEEILKKDANIHKDTSVMATLAGSNNKVLKAFGKKGSTDFASFMSGTGTGSMQGYIENKGKEFIDGIDDKALSIISSNNPQAMNTSMLAEAAASVKNAESLKSINDMLASRNDVEISASQLASFDETTIATIQPKNIQAILKASDGIAADPKLISKLNPKARTLINKIRRLGGRADI